MKNLLRISNTFRLFHPTNNSGQIFALGATKRFYSQKNHEQQRICVIGAGPAGFYVTQHVIKNLPNVQVDIIEKWPVPFGLVRYTSINLIV